ncbi:MAG: bifunctional 2-C-methyl-D-erythritol 4-phosphate cytidylyltransferase/2-C-methyl-D-erythritol 2,4-cyclodiphosphate synthase [Xanthobacteraceae bacterium]
MEFAALVVAGGGGTRAGAGKPKQLRLIAGVPVLRRSLRLFTDHREIDAVQAVIRPEDLPDYQALSADLPKCLPAAAGGATRQASVHAGLESLVAAAPRFVLVHDAARPFAGSDLIDRAIAAVRKNAAAIPAIPVTDTIKRVDASGKIVANIERNELRAVQTPQAFRFDELLGAHRKAAAEGRSDFTDDAALMEWTGATVTTFEGSAQNTKLTTSDDFVRATAYAASELGDVRTGTGYDVHAFAAGDHVTLGGVCIPHQRALSGHSDADVLLHAMTDAILGAIGDGDIGQHFPPSDTQWRGADSAVFLKFAAERICARGGMIAHLNGTLICEAPKIGPHREAMRARIAEICGIELGRVGVQATTNEGLGFIGRSEGVAAMAVATIRLPWSAA